jgi:glutaredoxin 3
MNPLNTHSYGEPEVTIYGTSWCPYCRRAKALLDRLSVRYREIDVGADPSRRREMMTRAQGRHTVPQIFVGEHGIGGCDDLHALVAAGKLGELLRQHGGGGLTGAAPDLALAPLRIGRQPGRKRLGNSLMSRVRAWIRLMS